MRKVVPLVFISLAIPFAVQAKKSLGDAAGNLQTLSGKTGIEEAEVTNIVGKGIEAGLQVVGLLFFILMVYAGFKWMMSRGDEDKISTARNTIVGAVIGLVITISAYAITSFINTRVIEGQGDTGFGSLDTLGSGDTAEPLGCCISWTKADILSFSKSTWKLMTESTCKLMNEDLQFDPKNENKFAVGDCPGPKNGCWLFYEGQDAIQCEATWENL